MDKVKSREESKFTEALKRIATSSLASHRDAIQASKAYSQPFASRGHSSKRSPTLETHRESHFSQTLVKRITATSEQVATFLTQGVGPCTGRLRSGGA